MRPSVRLHTLCLTRHDRFRLNLLQTKTTDVAYNGRTLFWSVAVRRHRHIPEDRLCQLPDYTVSPPIRSHAASSCCSISSVQTTELSLRDGCTAGRTAGCIHGRRFILSPTRALYRANYITVEKSAIVYFCYN